MKENRGFLSGKYGFIAPEHPIVSYDVTFPTYAKMRKLAAENRQHTHRRKKHKEVKMRTKEDSISGISRRGFVQTVTTAVAAAGALGSRAAAQSGLNLSQAGFAYDYSAIVDRKPLRWPNGARIAVVPTINVETWDVIPEKGKLNYPGGPNLLPIPLPDDVPDMVNHTWREYGHRVGFWRILEAFDRQRLPATCTINTQVGRRFPRILSELQKRKWELVAHSRIENDLLVNFSKDPAAERAYVKATLAEYEQVVGRRAKGWLSPSVSPTLNTLGFLADEGVEFFCDFVNDDQPYPIRVGNRTILSMPYTTEINDYPLFMRHFHSPDEVLQILKAQFDTLYEEGRKNGRMMMIGLHPHVIGQPYRIGTLHKILAYMKGRGKVWFTSREQIADWYRSRQE